MGKLRDSGTPHFKTWSHSKDVMHLNRKMVELRSQRKEVEDTEIFTPRCPLPGAAGLPTKLMQAVCPQEVIRGHG